MVSSARVAEISRFQLIVAALGVIVSFFKIVMLMVLLILKINVLKQLVE